MINVDYNLLRDDDFDHLQRCLHRLGLCQKQDRIASAEVAGAGNMNLVLRVEIGESSFIMKQSRPWVQKYPTIAASDERIYAEEAFYRLASGDPELRSTMPEVLGFVARDRLLIMSDLGKASDYTSLYQQRLAKHPSPNEKMMVSQQVDDVFKCALRWLSRLHRIDVSGHQRSSLECHSIRQLNHEHIFRIPIQEPPAIDLDACCDGLRECSMDHRTDDVLRRSMATLGQRYLDGGTSLLHGDFYPGSWLQSDRGFCVIDPEFCFVGPAEFDVGVLIAHRLFCGTSGSTVDVERLLQEYEGPFIDHALAKQFAGVELVRRLIGVAQLPLDLDLQQRLDLLDLGRVMILSG